MIRRCEAGDFETIYAIINEAAEKYRGIIPEDRWKVPYMSKDHLHHEIEEGVEFWGYERRGTLIGVMGIQHVKDVTLIRHAYVLPSEQGQGIGTALLAFLCKRTACPMLIGTWAHADWAIRFYETRGFKLVSPRDKDQLLGTYWSVPRRQVETSVVLANQDWFDSRSQ